MNAKNELVIVEKPHGNTHTHTHDSKWPYVLGGFVAGAVSIVAAAFVFGRDEDEPASRALSVVETTDIVDAVDVPSSKESEGEFTIA